MIPLAIKLVSLDRDLHNNMQRIETAASQDTFRNKDRLIEIVVMADHTSNSRLVISAQEAKRTMRIDASLKNVPQLVHLPFPFFATQTAEEDC